MGRGKEYREIDWLQDAIGTARTRNGRPALDWLSRRSKPRWRMLALNGQWYDRNSLRARRPTVVPHSRRPLTEAELATILDPNPWSLAPGHASNRNRSNRNRTGLNRSNRNR